MIITLITRDGFTKTITDAPDDMGRYFHLVVPDARNEPWLYRPEDRMFDVRNMRYYKRTFERHNPRSHVFEERL